MLQLLWNNTLPAGKDLGAKMYVIIVGCGRVGSELAKLLSNENHNVVVIDQKREAFERLGSTFNGLTMAGNGFDLQLLKRVGIEKADAFCAVTNGQENI